MVVVVFGANSGGSAGGVSGVPLLTAEKAVETTRSCLYAGGANQLLARRPCTTSTPSSSASALGPLNGCMHSAEDSNFCVMELTVLVCDKILLCVYVNIHIGIYYYYFAGVGNLSQLLLIWEGVTTQKVR